MKTTELDIRATLEIDSTDAEAIRGWPMAEVEGRIWQMVEMRVPVEFELGATRIRGTMRFLAPTPSELKAASDASGKAPKPEAP
ncbi:hypothetical protein LJR084_007246 [Variovorax sp. LjRoot84]|uniref:hypothetical protein n=1 Tax=unclassified Variovorax TaxID=663243 RepID=UPI003ECD9AAF